jgi:hypothetical protein
MHPRSFLRRYGIVVGAALISIIGSTGYACTFTSVAPSFCRGVAWVGLPGMMCDAVLTVVLGSIVTSLTTTLIAVATFNFAFYLGISVAIRKLVRIFRK